MKTCFVLAGAAAAVLLTACNNSPEADRLDANVAVDGSVPTNAPSDEDSGTTTNDVADQPHENAADGGSAGNDADGPAGTPDIGNGTTIDAIPAKFVGRWGLGLSACGNPVQDRDGIITVTSQEVHFRELRAVATSIEQIDANRVRLNTKVDRGADDFTVAMDLVLSDGGRRLTREEEGPRESYVRCPRNSGRLD